MDYWLATRLGGCLPGLEEEERSRGGWVRSRKTRSHRGVAIYGARRYGWERGRKTGKRDEKPSRAGMKSYSHSITVLKAAQPSQSRDRIKEKT